jgi:hypothetical protein
MHFIESKHAYMQTMANLQLANEAIDVKQQ